MIENHLSLRTPELPLLAFLLVVFCATASSPTAPAAEQVDRPAADDMDVPFGIGGCGGAYFLAAPGTLVIDVYKRDRHRSDRTTELRAILVGPDRRVLDEASLPDDGLARGTGLGPLQQVRLQAEVPRTGVYGLNITVSQDRYGDEIVWGFRTNCDKYLIETSRGHRDERRQEPIVLLQPDRPGNVCFLPRRGSFRMELADLPRDTAPLSVYDASGTLVHTLRADADGRAAHTFPADPERGDRPWRLELPAQQATIQIDGVTRWDSDDRYANLPCWTPDPASWFSLLPYRWLLTPYQRTVYGRPGQQGSVAFRVHNNSQKPIRVRLEQEFPDRPWPVQLSAERVEVSPGKSVQVTADYTIPADGSRHVCHMRATPADDPEFTTYATLTAVAGEAPAAAPLPMPIELQPYQHENAQFGYLPDYPVENQVYFDLDNRPCTRADGNIATLAGDRWSMSDMRSESGVRHSPIDSSDVRLASTKIAFDGDNDVYVLGTAGRQAVLLHSRDGGRTFAAYPIPGSEGQSRTFDIEQFSGHNVPDGPPPIVRYTRTASDPKLRWRRVNDLELILAEKTERGLTFAEPVMVSRQCIGLSAHSGIPSTVVSRGSKVHVAWGEATDPAQRVPGVPTYVATYDRATRRLSAPALVGHGPPANDVHNSPSITMDSRGYLHVLAGTHGQPFPYARSLQPNDAGGGWTDTETVGEARQTYLGLVCGADDTLHLVFRMWRQGAEPHPLSHHATLAYQRKRPGQPWEEPRVLVVAPFSEYSIFYHRLTVDRLGRLFLSYDYWSTYWFYRTDHFGDRRALLISPDGGDTWKLVEQSDF
jgi:hypothetical protein